MPDINFSALYHLPWLEYRQALPDGRVMLRLRTGADGFDAVRLWQGPMYSPKPGFEKMQALPMRLVARDQTHAWYEITFMPEDRRLHYLFELETQGLSYYIDQDRVKTLDDMKRTDGVSPFAFAYAYPTVDKPDWAKGAVGYQIFPDRFRRAGRKLKDLEPWDSDRVQNEYRFGGNLKGVLEAVPYLSDLGVDILYMTPLFESDTSHRYNTFDYLKIDPLLGSEEDLRKLVRALHKRGMRLVLDGVFNHAGTGFAPFMDAIKNGKKSAYYDWFFFEKGGYQTFADVKAMPKLNLDNEACAQYFLDVGRYWVKNCDIDGWRLDVSPEVSPAFWRRFRQAIDAEKKGLIMVAECWDDSRQWLNAFDSFDATMHYVLSRALWGYLGRGDMTLSAFDHAVNRAGMLYPPQVAQVNWNFLGSHDTPRFLTVAGEDKRAQKLAYTFLFTHPGVPIVYYGDELGMAGAGDPFCRFPMRWDWVADNPTHQLVKGLAALRHSQPALRLGNFETRYVNGASGFYAYERRHFEDCILTVLRVKQEGADGDSQGPSEALIPVPEALRGRRALTDLLTGATHPVVADHVHLSGVYGDAWALA